MEGWKALATDLLPTYLITGTTVVTFQLSGKDSFKQILRSADMYRRSSSQFWRTNTEIQSGPNTLEELMLVITFLTILGVTEM